MSILLRIYNPTVYYKIRFNKQPGEFKLSGDAFCGRHTTGGCGGDGGGCAKNQIQSTLIVSSHYIIWTNPVNKNRLTE